MRNSTGSRSISIGMMRRQLAKAAIAAALSCIGILPLQASENDAEKKVACPAASVRYENNQLLVAVGQIKACFLSKTSWTLNRAYFDGQEWLVNSGFMQSVLYEKFEKGALPDPFLGSGHRPETVDMVTVRIMKDGAEIKSGNPDSDFSYEGEGDTIVVAKKSRFISAIGGLLLEHESQVSISGDGIREQFWNKGGDGNLANVPFMYPFMHIFPNSTKYWIAGNDDGGIIQESEFGDDGKFTLEKPIRWAVVMDPKNSIGTVYCYPETYKGKNRFWNRTYDNKLYLMIGCVKKQGEEASYSVKLCPFKAEETDWRQKAQLILIDMFKIPGVNLQR